MRTTRTASNSRDLRVLNRLLVRDMIRRHGPIARHEIARITGLTPPTVTVIVNDLINAGVVAEVGHGESSGGRRPIMLELNPRAALVFAVRIQRGEVAAALLDLMGNMLGSRRRVMDTTMPEEVVRVLGETFDSLATDIGPLKHRVLWCGVASPGLIDSHRGVVERSSNLAWEKVPFGAMLSGRLMGIPVHVENISNAAALAEKTYGSGRGYHNLIYLNLSVGIGAGIIIDNEIYGGSRGYAGEVGHMAVVPEGGPSCTCGRQGCFEAMCGVRAVVEKMRARVPKEVFARCGLIREAVGIEEIVSPPLVELPEVREVFRETGRLVGVAVANLISLFNPEVVILGGELTRAGEVFLNSVVGTARERILSEIAETVKITSSGIREDPPLMGAYALALERVFNMEDWGQVEEHEDIPSVRGRGVR